MVFKVIQAYQLPWWGFTGASSSTVDSILVYLPLLLWRASKLPLPQLWLLAACGHRVVNMDYHFELAAHATSALTVTTSEYLTITVLLAVAIVTARVKDETSCDMRL